MRLSGRICLYETDRKSSEINAFFDRVGPAPFGLKAVKDLDYPGDFSDGQPCRCSSTGSVLRPVQGRARRIRRVAQGNLDGAVQQYLHPAEAEAARKAEEATFASWPPALTRSSPAVLIGMEWTPEWNGMDLI